MFLDCSYSGKRLRYFTGEKCEVKDWDSKKMRFRLSFDGWMSANDLLDSLESRLLSSFRLFRANGVIPSVEELRNSLRPEKSKTFIEDFRAFMSLKKERVRKNSMKGFDATLKRLERFEAVNGKFYLSDYTQVLHDKFCKFQINEGFHPNTVSKSSSYIRCFLNEGKADGFSIPADVPIFKTKEIEPETIFLTVAELEKVERVELSLSLVLS